MKYIIGIDAGIGSVGWAVIRADEIKRIEDFGVRLFNSGEDPQTRKRESQKRRGYRSVRRLIRRRSHRKWRIKSHFENIGLCKVIDIEKYFETASTNIIDLRVRAIDEKITPEELAACLINICNKRGYKSFYEIDPDNMSTEDLKEMKESEDAITITSTLMKNGGYRTVAEMILNDPYFNVENSEFKKYRNNKFNDNKILFTREMLKDETVKIFQRQREYYSQLTDSNIDYIIDVIFSQRDFEDGPGNANDKYRKYSGFLDSLGNCTFYKDEKRGSRFTLIADIYSLVNTLSQINYIDTETGEIGLPSDLANSLINFAIQNGKITVSDIKRIAKDNGKTIAGYDGIDIVKNCFKFTKAVKSDFEEYGYNWAEIASDYMDENSFINRIGIFLSENITPKRRKERIIKEFPELGAKFAEKLITRKASGTTNACYRFMRDSIEAFLRGESYGSFQAQVKKDNESAKGNCEQHKILPPFNEECEFFDNPVVFRTINETRKTINAIVRKYGSPYAINIEVGSELNKSLENRKKEEAAQRKNQKLNENVIESIAKLIGKKSSDVKPSMVERYKLGEEQGWKCLYSGKPIDMKEAILNRNHTFEVDHIVPFSLILDNTLKNKALVYYKENQAKGQRTPLMYLSGSAETDFIGRVNTIYGKKKEHKVKYKYLMLREYNSDLLSEWKSRNINDTRYICNYLVNYLRNNLIFEKDNSNEKYKRQTVYAVKSAITSRMRRQWLNAETWGNPDKSKLKELTCLDHAVDAIVIANCIPAYVEMAALNQKLKDIFYGAGKVETQEYLKVLNNSIENLYRYYGVPKNVSEKQLRKKKTTPSLITNLREEVDIRVCDCEMERKFRNDPKLGDENIKKLYNDKVMEFYHEDKAFVSSLRMPLFSLKQDKKLNREMFDDNPLSIKNIDGIDYQIRSISILNLKKKDIHKLHTNDKNLIEYLNDLMMNYKDDDIVGIALKALEQDKLIYNGRQINKVKVKSTVPADYFTKKISENNQTTLNDSKYYCIEIYETTKGKTGVCGIRYSNLVLKKGKLYLAADYKYPDDYKKFIMYIYPGDYIMIEDGKNTVEGYYKGIKAITRKNIYVTRYNNSNISVESISQKSKIHKYDIDILGNVGGEIRCGEPLSLITEKN